MLIFAVIIGVSFNYRGYCLSVYEEMAKYAAKIQKYEPAYAMPKKAGCISFGK